MQTTHIIEATPGTTPATPAGIPINWANFDPGIKVSFQESKRIRSDRMEDPGAPGPIEATPTGSTEVSYGILDDLLSMVFGADWATNILKVGTTYIPKTATFEAKDEGTAGTKFLPLLGVAWSKLTISGGLGQNVEVNVDGVAMSVPASTVATLFTTTGAANTEPVYGSGAGAGTVSLGGTALGNCTKWSVTFDNSTQLNRAWGKATAHSVRQKNMKISASLDLYHEDQANYGRLTAGTELVYQLVLGNGTTKSYQLDCARTLVTGVTCPDADGVRTETVALRMFAPKTGTDTAAKWTRKP